MGLNLPSVLRRQRITVDTVSNIKQEIQEENLPKLFFGGQNFLGVDLNSSNDFPPDSMGVVGPSQFIVAVNGRIRSFNKNTAVTDGFLNVTLDTFFQSVRGGSNTSDPRIRYDRFSRRWFIGCINVLNTNNKYLLAVSSNAVILPSTVWTYFSFVISAVNPPGDTGEFFDYDTMGIDSQAIYVGGNIYTSSVGSLSSGTGFVIQKSSVLSGGPIQVTAFRNLYSFIGPIDGPYTPQGVDNFDPNSTDGYFIGVDFFSESFLALRIVSNPGSLTPTISGTITMPITPHVEGITVNHLGNTGGTNGFVDSLGDRLMNAHIRIVNGTRYLFTTITDAVDNTGSTSGTVSRDGSRWYQFDFTNPLSPTLFQSGLLFTASASNDTAQLNYFMPTVMTNGQGHMLLGCTTSGTAAHLNAATAFRLVGDTPGTLQAPSNYTNTATAYNPPGDTGGAFGRRWGDFSMTSVDPMSDQALWTIQEYCSSTNVWGVRVFNFISPGPATPVSCVPSTVTNGLASTSVTLTGSIVAGSAFFQSGTGIVAKIRVLIDGLVIVTNVVFVDTTHLTFNVNTLLSTAGSRNVTVVNPDDQFLTATGILTVV